ncbi:MAG: DUF2023 family protein, partial [Chitinispirillaceae bacterium]
RRNRISFYVQKVNNHKINVFFGAPECVAVIESFGRKELSDFTDEEDFILGVMLGYDKRKQCERYLKRTAGSSSGGSGD